MKRLFVVAPLLLALFVFVACSSGGGGSSTSSTGGSSGAAFKAPGGTAAAAPGQVAPGQPATDQALATGEGNRVIRTANITVEVKSNGFDGALDNIFAITNDLGGYVSGSVAQTETGSLRTGTVTFMVPTAKFQDAIARVRKLGTVQQFGIGGQDVSVQYVDLQARLKNAQAQQAAYTALLARATTIQDIINVQTKLGEITAQIEQLEGQIQYFDHATSFSSVAVNVREAPAAPPAPADTWGFKTALLDSLHGFVNTLDWMILGLGSALPVLVILGLLGLGWWRWFRRSPAAPGRAA